jgi:predicted HicB family RNase H-like nuclease
MSKPLTYRGYAAHVEFDAEDRLFSGRVTGIVDIVTFHGESVSELEQAFHDAVDDYLAMSVKLGRPPQKPCSGKLMLRLPPEVHARALLMAEAHGKSLNQWATEVLAKAE